MVFNSLQVEVVGKFIGSVSTGNTYESPWVHFNIKAIVARMHCGRQDENGTELNTCGHIY